MARTVTPTIPPKMYRHFAVVTVMLTTTVALFADGENRQAAAATQSLASPQESAEPQSPAASATPAATRRSEPRRGTFSSDAEVFDPHFGRPPARTASWDSMGTMPRATFAGQPRHSEHYLAALSDEGQQLLQKELETEGRLSPAEREQRAAALIAASAHRTGGSPIEN